MPGLFSDYRIKNVRLRSRIAMRYRVEIAPQYSRLSESIAADRNVTRLGAGAFGGAGLVLVEPASSPDGRATDGCLGVWNEDQAAALARIAASIKSTGAVPGIQLGQSRQRGGRTATAAATTPQASADALTGDIAARYAAAARCALAAGFKWLELHPELGFAEADADARFLVEMSDAVRAVWPETLPLTLRIDATDCHSAEFLGTIGACGFDLVNIGVGPIGAATNVPVADLGYMVAASADIDARAGFRRAASWNLADPACADELIRLGRLDLLMIGRPTLANPYWPFYAAMVLGESATLERMPDQYRRFRETAQGMKHAVSFADQPLRHAA